jgi:kinesin family protein C2/C3
MLEIYNETVRDLLQTDDSAANLEIKQDPSGSVYCPGAKSYPVACRQDVLDFLDIGSKNRITAATNCNEHSSRSHCVLSISVQGENLKSGEKTASKLHLIDLAGSERLSRSGVVGQQQREAQNINKSLSALGDVVMALFQNSKPSHTGTPSSRICSRTR